jgi:hypothetical protein
MIMKRFLGFIVAIALCGSALAQVPTSGNIFVGYSLNHGDAGSGNTTNLNGWEGSLEGKIFPHIGLVADVSGHYGSQNYAGGCVEDNGGPVCGVVHADNSVYNILFGPRVSFSVGNLRPFAHVLVGASHTSASGTGFSTSDTSFGDAIGGGLDYRIFHAFAWRVQGDFLETRFYGGTQNDFRFSTGLVLHF